MVMENKKRNIKPQRLLKAKKAQQIAILTQEQVNLKASLLCTGRKWETIIKLNMT